MSKELITALLDLGDVAYMAVENMIEAARSGPDTTAEEVRWIGSGALHSLEQMRLLLDEVEVEND